jgi:hypothetical protein
MFDPPFANDRIVKTELVAAIEQDRTEVIDSFVGTEEGEGNIFFVVDVPKGAFRIDAIVMEHALTVVWIDEIIMPWKGEDDDLFEDFFGEVEECHFLGR